MREFYLTNALGTKMSLNDTGTFLNKPKGLGQEHTVNYQKIGNSFIKLEDLLKQKKLTGNIRFTGYDGFHEFSKFIQHKPLVLEYRADGIYSMDVSIDKLEKGELEDVGLQCAFEIKGLSTWYEKVAQESAAGESEGKKYDYDYDYTYMDDSIGEVTLQSDSTLQCPMKITIMGPCVNPTWTHYLNDEVAAVGKVNCDIPAGHRLVVNAESIPFSIAETDENGVKLEDHYKKSDWSTQRFLFAGYGTNRITFTHDGAGDIRAIAEVRVEYESV